MSEMTMVKALIRRLGDEVSLTDKELIEAEGFQLERCAPQGVDGSNRYRVYEPPATIEGEMVISSTPELTQ